MSIIKSKYRIHRERIQSSISTLARRLGVNIHDRVCRIAILNRASEICGCEQHDVIAGAKKDRKWAAPAAAAGLVILLWAAWSSTLGAGISCAGTMSKVVGGK